jgi:NTE family protein
MGVEMSGQQQSVDLVLEGGGVKGIGLLGAVLTLHEAGYRFERIAGTSAGAIVAALVTAYQKAGRDLRELVDVMGGCEYRKFEDASRMERLTGVVGEGVEVLLHEGAHTGSYLYDWLGPILADAGVTTFADLRIDDQDSSLPEEQRYSLVVHTSDLSRQCLVRLPWDYHEYGQRADDQRVIDAVRASMSYPFFFRPVQFTTGSGGKVTWVDGGLLSNFPITVFDRTDGRSARWPTWGIKLSGRPVQRDKPVRSAPGLAISALRTMLSEWNRYALDDEGVNQRTIFVDTTGVSTLDFNLSEDNAQMLYRNGQAAARKFLSQLPQPAESPLPQQAGPHEDEDPAGV